MTNDEKKELFLQLLEYWFEDDSRLIDSSNCIDFYNYFIDFLEFEVQFSSEYDFELHSFLCDFIELLRSFPQHIDKIVLENNGLEKTMFIFSNDITPKNIKIFTKKLFELFFMVKSEYFL